MAADTGPGRWATVTDRIRAVVRGPTESRLRATWRVLLAVVLFVVWTAAMLATLQGVSSLGTTLSPLDHLAVGVTIGTVLFFGVLVPWARYVDRRPIATYGFSLSRTWWVDLGVGAAAVALGTGLWYGASALLGWTTVEVVVAYEDGPFGLWLGVLAGVWLLSGFQQATFFFGLVLKNAAEGLARRDLPAEWAVLGAWGVTVVLFAVRHTPDTGHEVLVHLTGGAVFAALYVHSGQLALPIGAIGAGNYVNTVLFVPSDFGVDAPVVVEVTQSLPAGLGLLDDVRLPSIVIAYLVVAAWLQWQRDGLALDTTLTRWTGRESTPRSDTSE